LQPDGSDRLTWLGHAAAMYQSGQASVALDLFMRPHIFWTEEEKTRLFSPDFGEALLFDDYGPNLLQVSPVELPRLDAVLITHQDVDHFALSTLMLLPEETTLVVPKYKGLGPWEVDMKAAVHRFLGPRRRVLELDHYQSHAFGDIRVTALPFRQEMPQSLPTNWNAYLLEGKQSTVCALADATLEDAELDFLEHALSKSNKPLTLCGRAIHAGQALPGYRDNLAELYNFTRLWGWYTPVFDLFSKRLPPGPTTAQLRRLSEFTHFDSYLPYAMGTMPCCRITGVDPLQLEVANQSAEDVKKVDATVRAHTRQARLFPGKFGKPFRLA
jgi:L-ascorbate metabolism protein UlaG (beta-lactamase superfamily)